MSGSRVTRLAALTGVLVLSLDLLVNAHPSVLFDVGFVVICVGAALAVRPADFFRVGVLPPLLLLALMTVAALVHRAWLGPAGNGVAAGGRVRAGAPRLGAARRLPADAWPCSASGNTCVRQHRARSAHGSAEPRDVPGAHPLDHRRAVGEVDDRGGSRAALTGVDHRVDLMVQLLLDQPAVGHR